MWAGLAPAWRSAAGTCPHNWSSVGGARSSSSASRVTTPVSQACAAAGAMATGGSATLRTARRRPPSMTPMPSVLSCTRPNQAPGLSAPLQRFHALMKCGAMPTTARPCSCALSFNTASSARGTAAAKNGCAASQSAVMLQAPAASPYSNWKRSAAAASRSASCPAPGGGVTCHSRARASSSTKLTGQPAWSAPLNRARSARAMASWLRSPGRKACPASGVAPAMAT